MASTSALPVPYTPPGDRYTRPASDTRAPVTQTAWMALAVQALGAHILAPAGIGTPRVRAAIGWTMGKNVRGQCHVAGVADGIPAIYVRPVARDSGDAATILDILVHELLHAVSPTAGHRGQFAQDARAIGLDGPLTATHAGEALADRLAYIANVILPPVDHSVIGDGSGIGPRRGPGRPAAGPRDAGGHYKPQTGRMLKAECGGCGMVIRTTRKWLETTGLPECACGAGTFRAA